MDKQRVHLKVLATTDLHAYVTNYDYYRDECLEDIGLIGLVELIQQVRCDNLNTLLLDNGDFLQGNPIGNYLRDYALEHIHPIVSIMNHLNYDVGTLGNHEFDFGIEFLEKMLSDIRYPIINANIVDEQQVSWIEPYVILDRILVSDAGCECPIKIGVIGVLPPQVTQWNHKVFADYAHTHQVLQANDILDSIHRYIPEMRQKGADLIFVLAHSGFSSRAYEKGAENVIQFLADIDGIDGIIAGHAHSTFPDQIHHFDTPIVMAGAFGQYLGVIDLALDYENGAWTIVNQHSSLLKNTQSEQLTASLFETIRPAHSLALELMNLPIGENRTVFTSALSLIQDDACIQLIADAQEWYARKLLNELQLNDCNLPLLSAVPAFKVGGRKNAPYDFTWIDQGIFTFKNVADLYPFNNQLALINITGKNLKEWLECANSIYYAIDEDVETGQSLINWGSHRGYNRDVIKGGIEYAVDVRNPRRYNGECTLINPESERIRDLIYQGRAILDMDRFILATNQYRAYSGKFPGSGEEHVIGLSTYEIPEIIEQYLQHMIQTQGYIDVVPSDNWSLILGRAKQVMYESSPLFDNLQYIQQHFSHIQFTGEYDTQKFALFSINE